MEFSEDIYLAKSTHKDMAIFRKVIIHDLVNHYSENKSPKYKADIVANKSYTYEYIEAQAKIAREYNISPLMVSVIADLWNKTVLNYLSKYNCIPCKNFKISNSGLLDLKLPKALKEKKVKKTNIDKRYLDMVNLRKESNTKYLIYFAVFSDLLTDVKSKGFCFNLDSESHRESILLLKDYLYFILYVLINENLKFKSL